MIAKAKSISHGINDLNYISGVSANKKKPEKIFHICDNHLPTGTDPSGIWNQIKLASMSHPRMKNNTIRIEISPTGEESKGFKPEDWKKLWEDFVKEFDHQVLKDKNGNILSPETNIAGSISTVYVHYESESGIPHLHAAVCRVDQEGNINNDRNIHLRAQRAAEKVALKRGWTAACDVRENNKLRVSKDCLDVLRGMERWSANDYFARLRAKGYDVRVRKDKEGKTKGYVLRMGNARYKASELGHGRNLMVSKLRGTWNKLHEPDKKLVADEAKTQSNRPDYTKYRDNTRRMQCTHDGKSYTAYIPNPIMEFFEEVFDYRRVSNWAELLNEACYHFAIAMTFFAKVGGPVQTSGGTSGPASDPMYRSRDKYEEEMARARRCAEAAGVKVPVVIRKGLSL